MNQSWVNIFQNQSDWDVEANVYTAEFVWSKVKPYTCSDLKLVRENQDEEFKCSFNIGENLCFSGVW
jgi:hypothetical protein